MKNQEKTKQGKRRGGKARRTSSFEEKEGFVKHPTQD
jgi:hypothetical protein